MDTLGLCQQSELLDSSAPLPFQLALTLFLCCRKAAATREECGATWAPGSPSALALGLGTVVGFCDSGGGTGMEQKCSLTSCLFP